VTSVEPISGVLETDTIYHHPSADIQVRVQSRMDDDSNILIFQSDAETGKDLSYSICKRDLSHAISKLELIRNDLVEYLSSFKGSAYDHYRNSLLQLKGSKKLRTCKEAKAFQDCNSFFSAVNAITEPYLNGISEPVKDAKALGESYLAWAKKQRDTESFENAYYGMVNSFTAAQNKVNYQIDLGEQSERSDYLEEYLEKLSSIGKPMTASIPQIKLRYLFLKTQLLKDARIP
jgi:hypothetical protein